MSVKKALIILGILFVITLGFFGYLFYDTHKGGNSSSLIDNQRDESVFDDNDVVDIEGQEEDKEAIIDNRKESLNSAQKMLEEMAERDEKDNNTDLEEQGVLASEMLEEMGEDKKTEEVDKDERLDAAQKMLEEMMNK